MGVKGRTGRCAAMQDRLHEDDQLFKGTVRAHRAVLAGRSAAAINAALYSSRAVQFRPRPALKRQRVGVEFSCKEMRSSGRG